MGNFHNEFDEFKEHFDWYWSFKTNTIIDINVTNKIS